MESQKVEPGPALRLNSDVPLTSLMRIRTVADFGNVQIERQKRVTEKMPAGKQTTSTEWKNMKTEPYLTGRYAPCYLYRDRQYYPYLPRTEA